MVGDLTDARGRGRRALTIALVLALSVVAFEVVGGLLANSLALLADAGHMVSDVVAVSVALVAIWMAGRPATGARSYGLQRAEVLAAAGNGVLLLLIAGYVLYETAQRLSEPPDVSGAPVIVIGALGLAANVASAWVLHDHEGESLNVRAAFYHVLGDMIGSVGVVISGIVIAAGGWQRIDALVGGLIGGLIVIAALRLLRESAGVLLESVPAHINPREVEEALTSTRGVEALHDLHIWTVTSGLVALSCHCELSGERDTDDVLADLCDMLHERFAIHHVTIQPELRRLHGGAGHSLPRCTSEIGHRHRAPTEV